MDTSTMIATGLLDINPDGIHSPIEMTIALATYLFPTLILALLMIVFPKFTFLRKNFLKISITASCVVLAYDIFKLFQ